MALITFVMGNCLVHFNKVSARAVWLQGAGRGAAGGVHLGGGHVPGPSRPGSVAAEPSPRPPARASAASAATGGDTRPTRLRHRTSPSNFGTLRSELIIRRTKFSDVRGICGNATLLKKPSFLTGATVSITKLI